MLCMYEVLGSIPSISKKCSMIFMRSSFTFFLIIYHNWICGICKPTEAERTFFNRGCSSVVERILRMYEVLGCISKHCSMTVMQNNFTFVLIISHNWIYSVCISTKAEKTLTKWGCSSVVERMLCMYEVLGSIPSISKLSLMCFMQIWGNILQVFAVDFELNDFENLQKQKGLFLTGDVAQW